MNNRLVDFPGHGRFWLLLDDSGAGPLAPLDQCDDHGDIKDLVVALTGESYAHLFPDGRIKRFHQVIGCRDDLVEVRQPAGAVRERGEYTG